MEEPEPGIDMSVAAPIKLAAGFKVEYQQSQARVISAVSNPLDHAALMTELAEVIAMETDRSHGFVCASIVYMRDLFS